MNLQQGYEMLSRVKRQRITPINLYGTAIEGADIVHKVTKFIGTTAFVLLTECRKPFRYLHSFQEGSGRIPTCENCLQR